MEVSPATREDIPRLCELLAILFAQEAEFTPDPARQTQGLEAIIGDPAIGQILVLREGGRIVGMVNVLFTVSTFLGAKAALLEDMIVHPDHRGKGAGTALVQAARQCAHERGCRRITLLTDGANAQARSFYEKMGFVASPMMPYRLLLEGQ